MTRETRYNLIFLALMLVLLVPGAVIVFYKKLQPTARPMFEPEPVPRAVAYMLPGDPPPGMRRIEPRHTAEWVEQVAQQATGSGGATGGAGLILRPQDGYELPVMSAGRAFQVIAMRRTGTDELTVWVLFWNGQPAPAPGAWTTQPDGRPVPITDTEVLTVPNLVRDELGENQVMRAPKTAVLQKIVLPLHKEDAREVRVELANGTSDSAKLSRLLASQAPTTH
jgi:hypothetical protein